ncbi:TVP38/TMEM64 family membrane protein slr0305-like [Macadamia integrifolia]|uniref:TVP38/TMEM64 family membrane protein slr0305-like n=1 Tax=Macadamia integrifolia TaxID=60698 RepID=UPI001C527DB7|nr:TVP38/TMEM64 family membrane protein slr0305-like [Macadamia integrifolia]
MPLETFDGDLINTKITGWCFSLLFFCTWNKNVCRSSNIFFIFPSHSIQQIVLLLRLVPILPFNMLNYLLSVTPVGIGEYMLASWLGMMPITFALVYVGTTLKDISDVTHGWGEISTTRWILIILGLVVSVVLIICVTKVAKSSLDKALAENMEIDGALASSKLPIVADAPMDLNQPLIIKIDSSEGNHEN